MKSHPMFLIMWALVLVLTGSPAFAHGLHVFAWLESGQIIVEGSFGKDRPAINADVTVQDTVDHHTLLTGKTNDSGRFTFGVPQAVRLGHPLAITVNAAQGHQGQWQLNPQEVYAAASLAAGFETADLASAATAAPSGGLAPVASTAPVASVPNVNLSQVPPQASNEHWRAALRAELDAQLAPLRQDLAAQAVRGPGLVEIIGGLGWIIGIVGIAMYFKSRKS